MADREPTCANSACRGSASGNLLIWAWFLVSKKPAGKNEPIKEYGSEGTADPAKKFRKEWKKWDLILFWNALKQGNACIWPAKTNAIIQSAWKWKSIPKSYADAQFSVKWSSLKFKQWGNRYEYSDYGSLGFFRSRENYSDQSCAGGDKTGSGREGGQSLSWSGVNWIR